MARATLHQLSDPLPPAIALDTSFVVKSLNRRDRDHDRAYDLYRRLVEDAVVCAICWPILRLEFWFAWDRAARHLSVDELQSLIREAREVLTGQGELTLAEPQPATSEGKRKFRLRQGERLLELLVSTLRVVRVRLTERLLEDARSVIVASGLKPLDAVVCAVALTVAETAGGAPSVAAMDTDFRQVQGLHLWGLS